MLADDPEALSVGYGSFDATILSTGGLSHHVLPHNYSFHSNLLIYQRINSDCIWVYVPFDRPRYARRNQ